ncbi:MAG TPA: efflux RND transporter periplasmic adaptor subunit [Bdellovibrio sp.]
MIVVQRIFRQSEGQLSAPLKRSTIIDAVYGIGTVTAYHRYSINPLVGSSVEKSYVNEGDSVRKGAPLVEIGSDVVFRAPFSGIVNFYPYRLGENTYTTTPLLILTDVQNRYIVVSMEQQGALRVKKGQKARISFDSLRESVFEGTVSAVYSYAGNFLARIDSLNLPSSILPEMTCDVAIVIATHENSLVIPVVAFENGSVWRKRGRSLPKSVPVKIGVTDGTWAEILEGDLAPGDRLLIRRQVSQ